MRLWASRADGGIDVTTTPGLSFFGGYFDMLVLEEALKGFSGGVCGFSNGDTRIQLDQYWRRIFPTATLVC